MLSLDPATVEGSAATLCQFAGSPDVRATEQLREQA